MAKRVEKRADRRKVEKHVVRRKSLRIEQQKERSREGGDTSGTGGVQDLDTRSDRWSALREGSRDIPSSSEGSVVGELVVAYVRLVVFLQFLPS